MIIFVTLGSQEFQFNRLLMAIDEQVQNGKITDKIFAQIGASDYIPRTFEYEKFLDYKRFSGWIDMADIVITHGGTATIINAIKKRKKVIASPRLSKFNEHVDDHQLQLIEQFSKESLICACYDLENLWKEIQDVKIMGFNQYESNTKQIIESIDEFVSSCN